MRIALVTPTAPESAHGNGVTARRWACILRELGNDVTLTQGYGGGRHDLLVALHARKSARAIAEFQELQGQAGKHAKPLRALLRALRTAKKRAATVSGLPAEVSVGLDALVLRVEQMLRVTERVSTLVGRGSAKNQARGFSGPSLID